MEEGINITQQIAELRQLSMPALAARYEGLFGKPPRVQHREWLWKRCAWKLQEQCFGGLSQVAKRKLEELISHIDFPYQDPPGVVTGKLKSTRSATSGEPELGTILVREWRGKQVQVQVLETGLERNGVVYKSLSAVAKAITGAHWNGKLFFRVTGRKRPQ